MARARSHLAPLALLVAAGCALFPRLLAFVAPLASPRPLSRRRVALAATQADVKAAKETFDLRAWAAKAVAQQGGAQAAAAQARADQAEQAYLALKAQMEGNPTPAVSAVPAAPAAYAAAPAAAAPVAGVPAKGDVQAAKEKAVLFSWAAKTLQKKGAPQAAEMQARATRKMHEYESLKAAFEKGTPAAAPAVASAAAPVAAAVTSAVPGVPAGVPTKEELAAAKAKADLIAWAAKTLVEMNSPQAAAMQAKANAKAQIYATLKAAYDGAPAPAPAVAAAAPVAAAASAAPVAATGTPPTKDELEKLKQETDLMVWAAKSLAAKGAPQAAAMQAKADQKVKTYETLKQLATAR